MRRQVLNRRHCRVVLGAALLGALATLLILTSCQRGFSGRVDSLSIGTAPLESSALLYVAESQHFFAANGLKVTFRDYDTGAASLNGLINGEVEIATPAEYALVAKTFERAPVSLIASIDKVQYFYIVGRKDRGIQSVQDLKGKKIGVVKQTIAEFYLGRFLELHGVSTGEVTAVNVSIAKSEDAIANGDVDAIVARPPIFSPVQTRLGANAVVWPAQSSQALHAILVGRNKWVGEYPDTVTRLLKSLVRAQEYVARNPVEARAVVRERLGLDAAYMETAWPQNQFTLSLDQSLIVAMEDEARWMISNKLTTEKTVPDFTDYVWPDGLEAVSPQSVNLIQ